ncbi:putative integral membrane protein Pth11-like [Aspergillus clavatus NRRL 1]|uniref:Integral membrane protein, putative n=1 Tax=Aspergillus clavatus (strain ATCC 1007 / CBS 513.65 / DSM 816 / NCTC 3887 / NRRL 1 / QM 1276 / 107) TaxID=344612 RepID=A1CCZ8_ASPCL|nr:integral membrane protein, putative [Aspergillus clavatus NRRL 1]EAW12405.1 integral membrane protein, putative [Aspergillus clavatus NRRL 1]
MSLDQISNNGVPGDFEHPNQDLRRVIIITLYFAFILSTAAVALRLVARKINGTRLYLDDYLILVALLFKYGCSIGVTILLFNGLGSHITMIPQKNLEVYLKIGWSNSFVYTGCILFIKLSILALYKRLFSIPRMIIAANLIAAFVILWALGVFMVGALFCLPVQKFWKPELEGTCIDSAKFYYGQQIPNILTDVVLLIMPIKVVWALQISKTQKLLLSGVFVVGILTLIFDIVRLVAMIHLTKVGPDITYNQVPVVVWTCIEAAVGITAACLSNLRPLFKLAHRRFWTQPRSPRPEYKDERLDESHAMSEATTLFAYATQYSHHTECSKA